MSQKSNASKVVKLDESKLLGFRIAGKTGLKAGVKVGGKVGAKTGLKLVIRLVGGLQNLAY
jgi:hypothetical protein